MKPRIFVSAVSRELKAARQLVSNTLLALGHEPLWQDIFETSSDDIRPMLRKHIDSCSAILQIVGDAYGAEPPIPDETFGRVSYTQYEALYAKSQGKKVYYLIAQSEMPRDASPETIDTVRDSSSEALRDVQERRALQRAYRDRVQSSEGIFYQIQSHPETELSVRRLKQDLEKLRRGFRSWMVGVSVALVLIVAGVLAVNQGIWQQAKKMDQTQFLIDEQSRELKELAAKLDNPKRTREQLVHTIERTYDTAIAEAEKLADWRKRDEAKQIAITGRDQNLGRVDEFLNSIETVLRSSEVSPEYLEMTRIFDEQGAEEAIAYIASRKEDLFAKFDREQDHNRKMNLLPILETVRKEVLLGHYDSARATCEQLLSKDPNWGDAIHEQFSIITELGHHAMRYEGVSSAHDLFIYANELANRLARSHPPHVHAQRDLNVSHNGLGDILLQKGQIQEALTHYEQGFKIAEKRSTVIPNDNQALRDLWISHDRLGDVLLQMGQLREALTHYTAGRELSKKLASGDSPGMQAQRDLLVSHVKLGDAVRQMGQPQNALGHYESGLKISELLAAQNPLETRALRDLAISYDRVGDVLLRTGQSERALGNYESGLKIREKMLADDPQDMLVQRDVSVSHIKVGDVARQLTQLQDALTHYESGLKISLQLIAVDPLDAQAQRDVSVLHDRIGNVLLQKRQPKEALEHYESGLQIAEKLANADSRDAQAKRDLGISHDMLGKVLLQLAQSQEAMKHYRMGLEINEQIANDDPSNAQAHRDLSISYNNLGDVLLQLNKPEEARVHYDMGLKIIEKLADADQSDTQSQRDLSVSHERLGDLLRQMGQLDESIIHYEFGLKITEKLAELDPNDARAQRELMIGNYKLGGYYLKALKNENAKERFQAGMDTLERMSARGQNVEQCELEKALLHQMMEKCQTVPEEAK